MNRLIILMAVVFALSSTGCSKLFKKHDEQTGEDITQADTANVDMSATGNAEPLPVTDPAAPQAVPTDNQGQTPEQIVDAQSPAPSPATDIAPPAATGSGEVANYTVQKGDTLMRIAFNLYGDISKWKDVYEMNKGTLKDASQLSPGMTLKYDKPASEPAIEKNGDPYLIKKGDTLGTIADDIYAKRSKWKKLWENNKTLIRDPNKIYAGFYLYYQMTEEERREAEAVKGKRGQQLGDSGGMPGANPAMPSAPAPAPAPTQPSGVNGASGAALDARTPGSAQ